MKPSLEGLAWRIFGPIDFAINILINGLCPFVFLGFSATVPLYGIPSVAIFLAPMVFFAIVAPTYFGYRNGVKYRNVGLGKGPLPAGFAWQSRALLLGLGYAAIGQLILWAGLWIVDRNWPDLRCSVVQLAVVDGLLAGILGYFGQVNGIMRANSVAG